MKRSLHAFLFALSAALSLIVPAGALLAEPNEGFTFTDEDVKGDIELSNKEEQQPMIYSLEDIEVKVFSYMQHRQEILNALKKDGRDNNTEINDAYIEEYNFFQRAFLIPWRSKQMQFSGSEQNKARARQLFEEIISAHNESSLHNLFGTMCYEEIFEKNASMELNILFLRENAPKIKEEARAFYSTYQNALRVLVEAPFTPQSQVYAFSGLNRFITPSGQLGPRGNIFSVLDFHSRKIGDDYLDKQIKTCNKIIAVELEQSEKGCRASAERLRALKAGKDVENIIAIDLQIVTAAKNWLKETKDLAYNLKDWEKTPEGAVLHYNLGSSSDSLWHKGRYCPKGTNYVGDIKRHSDSLVNTIKQLQKK